MLSLRRAARLPTPGSPVHRKERLPRIEEHRVAAAVGQPQHPIPSEFRPGRAVPSLRCSSGHPAPSEPTLPSWNCRGPSQPLSAPQAAGLARQCTALWLGASERWQFGDRWCEARHSTPSLAFRLAEPQAPNLFQDRTSIIVRCTSAGQEHGVALHTTVLAARRSDPGPFRDFRYLSTT